MGLRLSKDAPVGCQRMLTDTRKTARKHNIKIRFTKKDLIYSKGDSAPSVGYFDETNKTLAVSNFNDLEIFINTLAHESSHMDQWIDNRYLWDKCSPGYSLFFEWLERNVELKAEQVRETVEDIIRLERDCEIRAIKKLKKYKIPTDFDKYIRKMNCYLYGYLFFLEKRRWIPAVYNDAAVWKFASTRIPSSYKTIPIRLRRAFENKLKTIKK